MKKIKNILLNFYDNIKTNYINIKKRDEKSQEGASIPSIQEDEQFEVPALRTLIKLCSTHELA